MDRVIVYCHPERRVCEESRDPVNGLQKGNGGIPRLLLASSSSLGMTLYGMDLSFVIVNYKSARLTRNCIKSIIASDTAGLSYEIIVVDNASGDGVAGVLKDNFSDITLIESKTNRGYGGAANLGIARAAGDIIVVMNADIRLLDASIKTLYDFMTRQPRAGMVGPQLVNPDGSLQYTRCRFPPFLMPLYRRTPLQHLPAVARKIDRFLTKDLPYDRSMPAEWLFGAVLAVRREVVEQIGGFDERFFLAFEDTDWCRRVHLAGWEVWYCAQSTIVHYPHRFSGSGNWLSGLFKRNSWIHIASWLKYFWKYRK